MAKIRVYELARELKMESKKLVEDLNAGGLDIKNYMSTLDEEMTSKARKVISGAISEVVVEKRVKPRVIRRRKKIVEVEQEPIEQEDELIDGAERPPGDETPETIPEPPIIEKGSPPISKELEKPEKIETAASEDDAPTPAESVDEMSEVPGEEAPPRPGNTTAG